MTVHRRGLLGVLGAAIAAPALARPRADAELALSGRWMQGGFALGRT